VKRLNTKFPPLLVFPLLIKERVMNKSTPPSYGVITNEGVKGKKIIQGVAYIFVLVAKHIATRYK
jgi:hypothetical protein